MKKRIIFRADGNKTIGFGHVYRLLSLAGMLKDEFSCVFVTNRPDGIIKNRMQDICQLQLLDIDHSYIPDLVSTEMQMPFDMDGIVDANDIVILDGYHFKDHYQEKLRKTGCKIVLIDDLTGSYPFADVIINHAPGIISAQYNTNAKIFSGIGYALLREPFFSPFTQKKKPENVFISMGGSDRLGYTAMVCQALLSVKWIEEIHILCSDQFDASHLNQLRAFEEQGRVFLYFDLDAQKIVDVLDTCQLAFVAASTVLIEAYSRGLVCFTAYSALNQMYLYNGFVSGGFAKGLGHLKDLSVEKIAGVLTSTDIQHSNMLTKPLDSVSNHKKIFHDLAYANA